MSAKKINANAKTLFIYVAVLFILLLASRNIGAYLTPKTVLGVSSTRDSASEFWSGFLEKNPNYIPGLIETGRADKASEIDPNYLSP